MYGSGTFPVTCMSQPNPSIDGIVKAKVSTNVDPSFRRLELLMKGINKKLTTVNAMTTGSKAPTWGGMP